MAKTKKAAMKPKTKAKSKASSSRKSVSKSSNAKLPAFFGRKVSRPVVFVVLFAVIGAAFILASQAATRTGPIKGKLSQKCIDNANNLQVNANTVAIRACNGGESQQWTLTDDNTIRTKDGFCLDVMYGATANRTGVWLYQCSTTAN